MNVLYNHFKGLDLSPEIFLLNWFLTLFSSYFGDMNFIMRIWDNYLLEGEIFAIKTSLAILKYFEIELKLATFDEAVKILKYKKFGQTINE